MRTPTSVARHPIHPMLVPLPIGLWIFSFVCDLIFVFGSGAPVWKTVALYTMVGGIVGALLAALPGLIDLLSLPPGPRTTAIMHMSINLTIVVLFVINAWLRIRAGERVPHRLVREGPRVGVAAAAEVAWRFWLDGEPTVSTYRPHLARRRSANPALPRTTDTQGFQA